MPTIKVYELKVPRKKEKTTPVGKRSQKEKNKKFTRTAKSPVGTCYTRTLHHITGSMF